MKMPKWILKIVDHFKTVRRLIGERDYAWYELDKIRSLVESSTVLDHEKLKSLVLEGKDQDPPRFLPSSDIGQGQLRIQHWASKAFAHSFYDTLKEYPDLKNYLIIPFQGNDGPGDGVEIVIQKLGTALTPHEKSQKLEEENEELREELQKYKALCSQDSSSRASSRQEES